MAKTFTAAYNEDQLRPSPKGDNLAGTEVIGADHSDGVTSFGMRLTQLKTWLQGFFANLVHTHVVADVTDAGTAAAKNVGNTASDVAPGSGSTSYEVAGAAAAVNATLTAHTGTTNIHFVDAPNDSTRYIRFNNSWQAVPLPSSMAGNALYIMRVNAAATAYEHVDRVPLAQGGTNTNLSAAADGLLTKAGAIVNITTIPAGGLVGVSATQTLTNKTLDDLTTAQFKEEFDIGSKGSNFPITLNTAQKQRVTITSGSIVVTFQNPTSVGNWIIKLINPGVAISLSWTATTGNVYWAGGSPPTWTTSGYDLLFVYYDGANFWCSAALDFS